MTQKRRSSKTASHKTGRSRRPKTKTGSHHTRSLVPLRENMRTSETYRPVKSSPKPVEPLKPRKPLENIEALELEELSRSTQIVLINESNFWKLLHNIVQYGSWALVILVTSTCIAWYMRIMNRVEPVRVMGVQGAVVYQVGVADKFCRVIVESKPSFSSIDINGTPLIGRTPIQLQLPCGRSMVVTVKEDGYIPSSQMVRVEERLRLQKTLTVGVPTFFNQLRQKMLLAFRPILNALSL